MKNLLRRAQLLPSYVKHYATISATTDAHRAKLTYDEFINNRQDEAKRSIAVQVSSEKSFPELCNYCSTFGSIVNAQHYCVRHDDEQHYILLEYANAAEASAAIDAAAYNEELTGVPVRSPFLWFRAAGKRNATLKQSTKVITSNGGGSATNTLSIIDGTHKLENGELQTLLCSAAHIDEQIQLLHKHTQLNDLGVRMRFLAAMQVEHAIAGMFPAANAQPFGSSVNGFGKMGCDLDLILRFDREPVEPAGGDKLSTLTAQRRRNGSRLVYHTKENLSNGRSQTQRQMECIGDMLHLFLPGVCHVRRILQARVPIIKYHHEHLDLEVDLSMSNLTGFYMSELLYMFGELDQRVRPLTFSVRRWANACGLTNPSPGRWITNFSLTCLVMYFLQQLKQPILPSISALVKSADPQDIRITEDGINCTFGRDYNRIGFRSPNTSRVSELLLQFYEFYSQFDFHNRAVSLNEARALAKPDHSAMYIVNPFEQVLNVSKNVSLEECERFRIEVRNAAWLLESEVENNGLSEQEKLETPWGLLNLFKHPEKAIIRPNMFFKPRMVEVSDLFEKSNNATASTTNTATNTTTAATTTATATTTNTPQSFKNPSVRQQVQNIKAAVRQEVKQLRINAGLNTTTTTSNTRTVKENVAKSRRSR